MRCPNAVPDPDEKRASLPPPLPTVDNAMAKLEALRGRNKKLQEKSRASDFARMRTISSRSLDRAQTTIEDFVKSYFVLYGLGPAEYLKLFPVLTFVEATIYELDELNEEQTQRGDTAPTEDFDRILSGLIGVLQAKELYDEKVATELRKGIRYWERERSICKALTRCDHIRSERRKDKECHDQGRGEKAAAAAAAKMNDEGESGSSISSKCNSTKRRKNAESSSSSSSSSRRRKRIRAKETVHTPPREGEQSAFIKEALLASEDKSFDYRVLHRLLDVGLSGS
mmetsp:Transcript_2797/g.4279  ORF Transcript_2797/g.4279 Transcript_2797/m.4279 type:complete len:284 (+) Transcript_2797:1-852(+)